MARENKNRRQNLEQFTRRALAIGGVFMLSFVGDPRVTPVIAAPQNQAEGVGLENQPPVDVIVTDNAAAEIPAADTTPPIEVAGIYAAPRTEVFGTTSPLVTTHYPANPDVLILPGKDYALFEEFYAKRMEVGMGGPTTVYLVNEVDSYTHDILSVRKRWEVYYNQQSQDIEFYKSVMVTKPLTHEGRLGGRDVWLTFNPYAPDQINGPRAEFNFRYALFRQLFGGLEGLADGNYTDNEFRDLIRNNELFIFQSNLPPAPVPEA